MDELQDLRQLEGQTSTGEIIMTAPKNEKRKKLDSHWDDDVCWRTTGVIPPKAPKKMASGSPPSLDDAIVEQAADSGCGDQLAPRTARWSVISTISTGVQALIREHGLDDNQSALIKIARTDKSVQHQKVLEIAQRQPGRSRKVDAGETLQPESSTPLARGQNETEFLVETGRSVLTLDKVPVEQSLVSSAPISVPELPAEREAAATSQRSLSKATAFSDYPVLPDLLKRADVEAALNKLSEEYLSSRLRTILIAAPYKAGKRFIDEVLLPDFQKASQAAQAVPGDGGPP